MNDAKHRETVWAKVRPELRRSASSGVSQCVALLGVPAESGAVRGGGASEARAADGEAAGRDGQVVTVTLAVDLRRQLPEVHAGWRRIACGFERWPLPFPC